MKGLSAFILLALLVASSEQAQSFDQDKFFYPEMAARNGFQGHKPKIPEAKNLIGVWKRIGTASFIMSDPHASDRAFYADTIIFVPRDGEVHAVFYRGNQRAIVMDVEFKETDEHHEYLPHYSIEGTAKVESSGKYKEIDFSEIDYPRMKGYSMAAIKRVTSLNDKYMVLEFETEEEDYTIRSQVFEGFVKMEKGTVIPAFDSDAYNVRKTYRY